ncbi:hypothetical protein M0R45_001817 [Rubus argutus]|uniref:Uncharacterized protein n=1 Tax=Rubus argutus TaxID=59490 RepID=A0AAW1VKS5_RUBAR
MIYTIFMDHNEIYSHKFYGNRIVSIRDEITNMIQSICVSKSSNTLFSLSEKSQWQQPQQQSHQQCTPPQPQLPNLRGNQQTLCTTFSGLNSFSGLKAHNSVASLGLPQCTEQSFAKIVSSLRAPTQNKGRGGSALSSTCNAVGEIFKIAAIMNGLTLIELQWDSSSSN